MRKDDSILFNLFLRYFLIILFGLGNFYVFYLIFTPLTTYATYSILNIFSSPSLSGNLIFFKDYVFEIIPSCVAGAAYYLLFLITMSMPNINIKRRLEVVGASLGAFFIFNVLRLAFLISISSRSSFELIHWISWHFISTIFVIGIWIFLVKYFKIKSIPVYSDLKYLFKLTGLKKKKSKRNKKRN